MRSQTVDALIVGAGPAGLSAATELARALPGPVVVLEREEHAGGIPRHSDHPGFGMRDQRRFLSGPAYAARLADDARQAGATIVTGTMVTGWGPDGSAEATGPSGRLSIRARATVLATGARERPRAARLVPGDRPSGVYTTGLLQNLVYVQHGRPGTRAVVVGAELVSWSAVLTLRQAGCRTVLMTTENPVAESPLAWRLAGRAALGVDVAPATKVVDIVGRNRLQAVEVEHVPSGRRRRIACDALVFTGDWIPDHELARLAGLDIDPGSLGPSVDFGLRTSAVGVFAAGNLVHPVDTADVAALDGRHAAVQVQSYLRAGEWPGRPVGLVAADPFRWIFPSWLATDGTAPPRGRLLLWSRSLVRHPRVTVAQDGEMIAVRRLPWPASPGRVFRVPSSVLAGADPAGGEIRVGLD